MRRFSWIGWLFAAISLFWNATAGLAAPMRTMNPLEGQLLHHSAGGFYVYHNGVKYTLLMVDIGDRLIDAIPDASLAQRDTLFVNTPAGAPPLAPEPFPGYS
jgi:hypothetical protein